MDRCPGRADQPGRSVRREGRSRCVLSARLVRPGRRSPLRRLATHRLPGGLAIYPPSGHDQLTTVTSRWHAGGARAACPHPAGVCLADRLDFPRRSLLVLTCPGGTAPKDPCLLTAEFLWSVVVRDECGRWGSQVVNGSDCGWRCRDRGCCVVRARERAGSGARRVQLDRAPHPFDG